MWIDALKAAVGPKGWVTDPTTLEPHLTEWRGRLHGRTPIMVQPENTEAVAEVVRICQSEKVAIVPQGGNTGLCGGAIPQNDEVLLSLSRMNRVRAVDPANFSMTVDAGCTLSQVQTEAEAVNRLFPLSLASEGSCQIGGNLATNAGGINVIRYGNARQQVLGLEVVLADATIWDGLRALNKDNTGYDMKQVFIGSEGTLGIITGATLRLFPQPTNTVTAVAAMQTPQQACELLADLRESLGDRVSAFELISYVALDMVLAHIPDTRAPINDAYPWLVLMEIDANNDDVEQWLGSNAASGRIDDAVIAKNLTDAAAFWRIRHAISEAQKFEGASLKHDISVPVARMGDFLIEAEALQQSHWSDARPVIFGHVGDGNLHHNLSQPVGGDAEAFKKAGEAFTSGLYELVARYDGSFSAEHGVGVFKKAHLAQYRAGPELTLMKTLKKALDPHDCLNPGKIF